MSINASLFLRIPNETLTEREIDELFQSFHTVFSGLLIGSEDEAARLYHIVALRERLDQMTWRGDVTFQDDDLLLWSRLPIGHWYDFRYARGNSLPLVLLLSWWLENRVPEGEVYYARNLAIPDGVGRPLTDPAKGALMYHFCRYKSTFYYSGNGEEEPAQPDDEWRKMTDAYREDFGSLMFEGEKLDPAWANFSWRGLACRLAPRRILEMIQKNWDFPVPDITREDLEPLLTSFWFAQRLKGILLADEMGGLSPDELKPVLEPLRESHNQSTFMMNMHDATLLFDCLPQKTSEEVFATLLASDSQFIREQALALGDRIRSAPSTR